VSLSIPCFFFQSNRNSGCCTVAVFPLLPCLQGRFLLFFKSSQKFRVTESWVRCAMVLFNRGADKENVANGYSRTHAQSPSSKAFKPSQKADGLCWQVKCANFDAMHTAPQDHLTGFSDPIRRQTAAPRASGQARNIQSPLNFRSLPGCTASPGPFLHREIAVAG
jgi:hypothetical protein